jgi:hypothetical protein
VDSDAYLQELFTALTPILRSNEVRDKKLPKHQRLQNVRVRLEEKREELMSVVIYGSEVLDFLGETTTFQNRGTLSLPKRLTPGALKNRFVAWREKKEVRSVSDMLSEARRNAEDLRGDSRREHLLPPWERFQPSDFADAFGDSIQHHPLDGLVYGPESPS